MQPNDTMMVMKHCQVVQMEYERLKRSIIKKYPIIAYIGRTFLYKSSTFGGQGMKHFTVF